MRTVLSDGGRAAEDDEGLAGVLGLPALLPGRSEGDGLGVGVVVPEAVEDGREPDGHGRGLVEGEVLRDLCTERSWHAGSGIKYKWMDRRRTLAARSAATMVYCWKVARSLAKKPWNRLGRRLSQRGVGMRTRSTDILSPLAQLVTSEPTSSMMPEPSEPEMKG